MLSPIQDIIADIKAGKMVILVDEEDRENEGDLVLAADHVTPEAVNFMARFGRGLICLTLSEARCRQLNLPLMVSNNGSSHGTNFTLSIEAAEGVTTGISAQDRSRTVQAAVARNATAADLVWRAASYVPQIIIGIIALVTWMRRAGRTFAASSAPSA